MAKAIAKKSDKTESKTARKVSSRSKVSPSSLIEKACVDALAKLKALKAAPDLQADIEWCLGSYRHDHNPSGLYEMVGRALDIFRKAAAKNVKAVSKKLLNDLETALKDR